jgi:transcription initiation factor TFIID subunit TAF12
MYFHAHTHARTHANVRAQMQTHWQARCKHTCKHARFVSKETYYCVKRDLLQCQKRPTTNILANTHARTHLPTLGML